MRELLHIVYASLLLQDYPALISSYLKHFTKVYHVWLCIWQTNLVFSKLQKAAKIA